MFKIRQKQEGFVLIVSLILLVAVTLLVVNGMGLSTMSERMAGNHMDRGRAKLAAQQSITQGLALLQGRGLTCLESGCSNTVPAGAEAGLAAASVALPSAWSDLNAVAVTQADGQKTKGKFAINWLNNAAFTTGKKLDCKAYSVMGRGEGLSAQSVVVLQTVAYVCPIEE